jgi:hypothetical protein
MTKEKEIEIVQKVLRKFYKEIKLCNKQHLPIPYYIKKLEEFLKKNKVEIYPKLGEN